MKSLASMWTRLRRRVFEASSDPGKAEAVIDDAEAAHEEETVHGTEGLELAEQLKLIAIAGKYVDEYVKAKHRRELALDRGFALKSEMFVTSGDEPMYRVNMEVFYQNSDGQRKYEYIVSLVRFGSDEWHVFQVK